ncbi:DNA polymerase III subunit gamma/tau [Candidatus Dojkabacteria bacterium]|nr:DNA polymerase III subunit gamma/tau [Candidatus Dojkabacteria bacterium]
MSVLYRKYRSQTFDELIGQEHISELLKTAIINNKISHAYLLVGPRGLGKTSTARILAKALNCTDLGKDGNPCNKCTNCLAVNAGNFYDLVEIDAASNRGIDQIRQLKERVSYQPTQGKYKIYIIDEVHMLTNEAFNALLKTLEEPPAHVIFVLATTEVYKLPPTILSRCQRYDFHLGSDEQLNSLIEAVIKSETREIDPSGISLIVNSAKGSYRDALSLLDVVLTGSSVDIISEDFVRRSLGLPDDTMVYYFLENIFNGKYQKAIDMLTEVYGKGVSLSQFAYAVVGVLKDVIVKLTINPAYDGGEYKFLVKLSDIDLLRVIKLFIEAERELRNTPIPTLPLELVIAELAQMIEKTSESVKEDIEENVNRESNIKEEKTKSVNKANDNTEVKNPEKVLSQAEPEGKIEGVDLPVKKIEAKWSEVVENVKSYNGHLYAFLKQATIKGLKDNVLKLQVAFAFHKERITSAQSKDAIQNAFEQVFKIRPQIWCTILAQTVAKPSSDHETNNEDNPEITQAVSANDIVSEVEDIFKDVI